MDDEEAKAVKEVAKTTRKAIEAGEKIGRFLGKIVGDGQVELGAAFHDWARYFRYQNLLRIKNKVDEIHSQRRLQGLTVPIPPRYAIPLVQAASQEDHEPLQDLWAGLIANATDPQKQIDPKKIYIDILSALEPFDVSILQFMDSQSWNIVPSPHSPGLTLGVLGQELTASEEDIRLSLQNLARLGCVVDEYQATWKDSNTTSFGLRVSDSKTTFRLSPLGARLLSACRK